MSLSTHQPKTLQSARAVIRELQEKMGLMKTTDNVAPSSTKAPIAKAAASLQPLSQPLKTEIVDLASLTPKGLRDFFENSTLTDLRQCLSVETSENRKRQNAAVVAALYREIRSRR
jgi:hypothetical protein